MFTSEPFKPKIIEQYSQASSKFEELENPICIVGVPDLTQLGKYCVECLIQALKAEKILTYLFNDFEPIITSEQSKQPLELMQVDFYILKKLRETTDFILVKGNGSPTSPIGIHFLSDKVAEFICSFKPQFILSIATFPVEYATPTPRTYLSYTSEELLQIFKIDQKTRKNEALRLQLLQKGIVKGMNGLTISYAKSLYDVIGGILLSETVVSERKDYNAIFAVLEVLNAVLDLQLPLLSLKKDAKKYYENLQKKPLSKEDPLKQARRRIKA
ncbi:MAG: PAC2 family protein [Candidatus Helarchaeota archaeon]|nr:PAC2 family protein [Candidatus Helarchaeota archaeon]